VEKSSSAQNMVVEYSVLLQRLFKTIPMRSAQRRFIMFSFSLTGKSTTSFFSSTGWWWIWWSGVQILWVTSSLHIH